MIAATYYTHHNTFVAMLVFFAVLALMALIIRQVRMRRQRTWSNLPHGMRPITLYRDTMITFNGDPMPSLTESVRDAIAEGIEYVPFKIKTIGPRDMWAEMQDDWACES